MLSKAIKCAFSETKNRFKVRIPNKKNPTKLPNVKDALMPKRVINPNMIKFRAFDHQKKPSIIGTEKEKDVLFKL